MVRGRIITESSDFIKLFRSLDNGKYQTWQIWNDFILIAAIAISNRVDVSHFDEREEQYFKIVSKYTNKEADVFSKLFAELVYTMERSTEQDFLGNLYMQLNLGNANTGQFFTPYSVCKVMSEINISNILDIIDDDGYVTVNDPACGAGATLLAYANSASQEFIRKKSSLNWQNHILFTAQDIDMVTGLMSYIQLSLLGCAGYIKIADSLLNPMCVDDKLDSYWFTPMYFSDVWHYRRIFHGLGALMIKHNGKYKTAEKTKEIHPPLTYNTNLTEGKTGQLTLF